MSEHDNDRLEQFFRKATSKPDVAFNEDDWKKLESRLDAVNDAAAGQTKAPGRLAALTAIVLILFFTGALWVNYLYDFIPVREPHIATEQLNKNDDPVTPSDPTAEKEQSHEAVDASPETATKRSAPKRSDQQHITSKLKAPANFNQQKVSRNVVSPFGDTGNGNEYRNEMAADVHDVNQPLHDAGQTNRYRILDLGEEKIINDLIRLSSGVIERYKQKAVDELPGAEEANTVEAESVMGEEHVSDHNNHQNSPRLSLLLSIAPDFSTTSISRYSAPGKAFGAMIQYHLKNRWTVSAGVIKNNKQYTGDGEDYDPPYGYWKYYTNGKIPNTIYGSCTVLEFPLMVQYSIRESSKNRFSAGVGASSYLMLDESYDYVFNEPNPGAKNGWASDGSSRFLFNMINFTLAYEHQVLPGFMIGIEPYVKIPIEEIGWTNLKLFSTGASLTMRYVIFTKSNVSMATRSRGPD